MRILFHCLESSLVLLGARGACLPFVLARVNELSVFFAMCIYASTSITLTPSAFWLEVVLQQFWSWYLMATTRAPMRNVCISLCRHGPNHRSSTCGYAHSLAQLMHPVYASESYRAAFWAENVSLYYGQPSCTAQVTLLETYVHHADGDVPVWAQQFLRYSAVSRDGVSDQRDVFDLQGELCDRFCVSSVSDLFLCDSQWRQGRSAPAYPQEVVRPPWRAEATGENTVSHPPRKRRMRSEPAQASASRAQSLSILRNEGCPVADAFLVKLCAGRMRVDDIDARSLLSMDRKKFRIEQHDVEYSVEDLRDVAEDIGRGIVEAASSDFRRASYGGSSAFEGMLTHGMVGAVCYCAPVLPSSQAFFHGTSIQGLLAIMNARRIDPNKDGYVYSFREQRLCAEKGYSSFQYIGDGLFVRSCVVLHGDFTVKKGTGGPQMYLHPEEKKVRIAGFIVEVVSKGFLAQLPDVWYVSVAV